MKKIVIFSAALAALLFAACCTGPHDRIRNGDLIFVGIPASYDADSTSMDEAITSSTGSEEGLNRIHVAIAQVRNDSVWIIDATIKRGVDRHPLDTFLKDFTLKDGSYPTFEVKRLRDDREADLFVSNALKYVGEGYDSSFLPDNGAMYCSELVRDSYVSADGKYIFAAAPMNFKDKDGKFPVYWQKLFAKLGQPIPQDVIGTNPQDMSTQTCLESVKVTF